MEYFQGTGELWKGLKKLIVSFSLQADAFLYMVSWTMLFLEGVFCRS